MIKNNKSIKMCEHLWKCITCSWDRLVDKGLIFESYASVVALEVRGCVYACLSHWSNTWAGTTGVFLLGVLTGFLHPGEDVLSSCGGRRTVLCVGQAGTIARVLAKSTRGLWFRGWYWHRHWYLRLIAFRMNRVLRCLDSRVPIAALCHLPWFLQGDRSVRGLQRAGGSMVLTFNMRGPGILDLIGIITEAICALIRVATVNCRAVVVGCLLHLAVSQYLFQKLTGSWHPCRITLAPLVTWRLSANGLLGWT